MFTGGNAAVWRRRCRCPPAGAKGGKGTIWFPCPLLTPPNPPLRRDALRLRGETGVRGLGSGRRADLGTLYCSEFPLRGLPRITVRGHPVQGDSVPLRKAPLRSSVYPWSTKRPCGPLAFRRATEGSRVLRKGRGVKRGRETLVSLPLLFPPVNTGFPGPPKAAMHTPSEGVISPPAASRCIGGTACRQQTVKRKKTSAEGIRKRLPFVKRAFFSCFTSAYAADFRNYSSTFT